MQTTTRPGARPAATILFTGNGSTTMGTEIEFRMRRLEGEAERQRFAGRPEGLRQAIGHALMELGRAVHGLEPEPASSPAVTTR